MFYFKSSYGEVFAYDSVADREAFGNDDLVAMTKKQVEEHLNKPSAPLTREQIESARLRAYADPITGSDRLFSEAMRMQIMGEEGYEEVRARAVSRFEEIQARYPWPSE